MPAFRLLRVGVRLFIRPHRIQVLSGKSCIFGEKSLRDPQEKLEIPIQLRNQLTTTALVWRI